MICSENVVGWFQEKSTIKEVNQSCKTCPLRVALTSIKRSEFAEYSFSGPGGGGVLPYMGYIGMCGPKGYGFSAVLVINRVSILADFGHFGHK